MNFSVGDKCIDSLEGDVFLNSLSKFNTFEKAVFVSNVSPTNIKKLEKYFDIVIYGSYHRGMPLFDLVNQIYKNLSIQTKSFKINWVF